jgi:eukaryotic-like serine/threonine-protein kinase
MLQDKVKNQVMHKSELDDYIGKFLNNRYLIRELIGKGGMGRVYLAEDSAKAGMAVAIKVLSLSLDNQQMSQRFAREIFIGAQLGRKNKHIARVLSYGVTEDKIPFYVMEYLQGKNLKTAIKSKSLTISEFLEITYQICLGLECAHQGITLKGEVYPVLHRDIKPENIFITEDAKQDNIVKILDFGIAKFLTERAGMTLTESFIGSLPYCSPEHMEGRKLIDVRSDIYSLGVMMYEMLTGKHPFYMKSNSFGNWYQAHRFQTPPTFKEVIPQVYVPKGLEELVMSCLAKEVKGRPQNIRKILDALDNIRRQQNGEILTADRIVTNSSAVQLVPATSISEKACLQKTWPQNKPKALICFPNLLQTTQGTVPSLWAMLPKKEIEKFDKQISNIEFIYQDNLYPIILWVNLLCDSEALLRNHSLKSKTGADSKLDLTRWLSYFLDMKDVRGQKILQALTATGYYHLLFFALEDPTKCQKVITLTLSAKQRQQLLDWIAESEKINPDISPNKTKNILRLKYEKLKPEILSRIIEQQKNDSMSFREWLHEAFTRAFKFISRPIL